MYCIINKQGFGSDRKGHGDAIIDDCTLVLSLLSILRIVIWWNKLDLTT